MRWFRRRRADGDAGDAASSPPRQGPHQGASDAGLSFISETHRGGGNTYVTYSSQDTEAAKRFLRAVPIERERYFVVVETPDGTWGTDIQGIYLESLPAWRATDTGGSCRGTMVGLVDGFNGLAMAARGVSETYVVTIRCGSCNAEWIDAVRYATTTLARCPHCREVNAVDASGYTASTF